MLRSVLTVGAISGVAIWISVASAGSQSTTAPSAGAPLPATVSDDAAPAPMPAAAPRDCLDPGAIPREVEPDCGLPLDSVNGGCTSQDQGFGFLTTPITFGEKLRGTLAQTETARDTDWYRFTVTQSSIVAFHATGGHTLAMFLARSGSPTFCSGMRVLATATTGACEVGVIALPLAPGDYVACVSIDDSVGPIDCGDAYDVELIGVPMHCPGDINLDGSTNVFDFNVLAAHYGEGPLAIWNQGDLNGDGQVKVTDFNLLAGNYGCTP